MVNNKGENNADLVIRELRELDEKSYLFDITGCPGYEGYIPKNSKYEVCKYCGTIEYYH